MASEYPSYSRRPSYAPLTHREKQIMRDDGIIEAVDQLRLELSAALAVAVATFVRRLDAVASTSPNTGYGAQTHFERRVRDLQEDFDSGLADAMSDFRGAAEKSAGI